MALPVPRPAAIPIPLMRGVLEEDEGSALWPADVDEDVALVEGEGLGCGGVSEGGVDSPA